MLFASLLACYVGCIFSTSSVYVDYAIDHVWDSKYVLQASEKYPVLAYKNYTLYIHDDTSDTDVQMFDVTLNGYRSNLNLEFNFYNYDKSNLYCSFQVIVYEHNTTNQLAYKMFDFNLWDRTDNVTTYNLTLSDNTFVDDSDFYFCATFSIQTPDPSQATYVDGYEDGYGNGYDIGYEDGFNYGNTQYGDSYHNGYRDGYDDGFSDGSNSEFTFFNLFGAIADTPVFMIQSLFNFDLFGTTMHKVILSIASALMLLVVVRWVFGHRGV